MTPTVKPSSDGRARRAGSVARVTLPLAAIAVRLFGLRSVYGVLGRVARLRRVRAGTHAEAERIARAVVRAGERPTPIHAACLARSLVMWAMLRSYGFDATLRLGARTLLGRFQAHAWVEVDGRPVGEDEDVERIYAAFPLRSEHLGLRAG